MKTGCFVILNSVSEVMKAEKDLLGRGMRIDIIPTPREISSECGVVISFECGLLPRIREALAGSGLDGARFYARTADGRVSELE
jgi:hypothetical protein